MINVLPSLAHCTLAECPPGSLFIPTGIYNDGSLAVSIGERLDQSEYISLAATGLFITRNFGELPVLRVSQALKLFIDPLSLVANGGGEIAEAGEAVVNKAGTHLVLGFRSNFGGAEKILVNLGTGEVGGLVPNCTRFSGWSLRLDVESNGKFEKVIYQRSTI